MVKSSKKKDVTTSVESTNQLDKEEVLPSDIDLNDYEFSSGDELFNACILIDPSADPKKKTNKPRAVEKRIVKFKVHVANCKCPQRRHYVKYCWHQEDKAGLVAIPNLANSEINNRPTLTHYPDNGRYYGATLLDEKALYQKFSNPNFQKKFPNSKISFAKCGLVKQFRRNSMVIITSPKKEIIELIISQANSMKSIKIAENNLHHDHCDQLHCKRREFLNTIDENDPSLGNHLRYVVKEKNRINFSIYHYFLMTEKVVVNADGTRHSIFNIPGGKRRLGEDSHDCAVRETFEEISFLIDFEKTPHDYKISRDGVNQFFSMMYKELEHV